MDMLRRMVKSTEREIRAYILLRDHDQVLEWAYRVTRMEDVAKLKQ